MLKSRTVADNLISRLEAREGVRRGSAVGRPQASGEGDDDWGRPDGIITVEVDDKDPKRAADLANAYVDELKKLTKVLASQKRPAPAVLRATASSGKGQPDGSGDRGEQGLAEGGHRAGRTPRVGA